MQWSALEVILPLHFGLVDEERLHQVHVIIHRGHVQRCSLLIRVTVYFGAIFNQETGSFKVSDVRRMMQGCPSIAVNIVNVCMAIFYYGSKCISFHFFCVAEDSFMNGSLTQYAHTIINLVATIDKVSQVL